MTGRVDATTLKGWLSDGGEIALLDVREYGQLRRRRIRSSRYRCPTAGSSWDCRRWCPTRRTRLVLCDAGDGVAERAARRARRRWGTATCMCSRAASRAGRRPGTRSMPASTCRARRSASWWSWSGTRRASPPMSCRRCGSRRADMVIVDGRTFAEFQKMNIPDGVCCPNGELALRIRRPGSRSQDQDRRQLRRPDTLDHRRADTDRLRRS